MTARSRRKRIDKLYARLGPSTEKVVVIQVGVDAPIVVRGREYTLEEFHQKFPKGLIFISDERERWERAERLREQLRKLNPPFER